MKLSNIIKKIKIATQPEVNLGASTESVVTPITLNGWAKLTNLSGDKKIKLKEPMEAAEIGCLITENGEVLATKLANAKTYSPIASTEFTTSNIVESSTAHVYGNYYATAYHESGTTIGKIVLGLLDETTGLVTYGTALEFTTDLCTEATSGRNLKLITTSSGYPVVMFRESDKRGIIKAYRYAGLLLTLKDTDPIYYTSALQFLDIASTDQSNNFIITYHQANTWKHTIQTATIGTGTKIYINTSDAKLICYCQTPESVALSSAGGEGYLFYNVDTDDDNKLKIRGGKLDHEDITPSSTILSVSSTVADLEAVGFDRNDDRGLLVYTNLDDNKTYMKLNSYNNNISGVAPEVVTSDVVANKQLMMVNDTTVMLGFESGSQGKLIKLTLSTGLSYQEVSPSYVVLPDSITPGSVSFTALTEDLLVMTHGGTSGQFVSVFNGLNPDHLLMSTAESGTTGDVVKIVLPFYKNNAFNYTQAQIGTKVTTLVNGEDVTIGIVTDINEIIITKTSLNAIGEISDINNLSDELNGRALTSHVHPFSSITSIPTQIAIEDLTSTDDVSLKVNEMLSALRNYGVINN